MGKKQSLKIQSWQRISLLFFALFILGVVYLFQQFNYLQFFVRLSGASATSLQPNFTFIFNKSVRMIINDLACFALIYVIFKDKKYLQVAFGMFLFELFIVLPFYFFLKLYLEGDSEISSPLLSQIHRLVINPMLMILLIIAFAYQRWGLKKRSDPTN
jgi:exosortase F-associated protein